MIVCGLCRCKCVCLRKAERERARVGCSGADWLRNFSFSFSSGRLWNGVTQRRYRTQNETFRNNNTFLKMCCRTHPIPLLHFFLHVHVPVRVLATPEAHPEQITIVALPPRDYPRPCLPNASDKTATDMPERAPSCIGAVV